MKLTHIFRKSRIEFITDLLVLLAIIGYIAGYFTPHHLLSAVTTTGGDTASHYYTAKYLKEVLLPSGRILGWMQGNYAGFPIFQFYFPFPFLMMVLISLVSGLPVAFKIVSVLGTFLLPVCTYFSFRLLRFPFPVPAAGALCTLPFLFMEANSMWGGNIPSTLAGEFTYSLGLALMVLFAGSCYRGITEQRWVLPNALLLALVGFNHGYTILFAVAFSTYFLIALPGTKRNVIYLAKVLSLAFCLIGFWIVPLLAFSVFTTRYNFIWVINSWKEILPETLWPAVILTALLILYKLIRLALPKWRQPFDHRIGLLGYIAVLAYLFYLVAFRIHVVDIRFLPFLQLIFCLLGAAAIALPAVRLRANWLFPLVLTAVVVYWTENHVTFIRQWISWNYSGFEGKTLWKSFSGVNQALQGTEQDPRVVYEHSAEHNAAGTIRAFESIPLFSGRNTLEGLYMQSTISSPFIFYIQSEISEVTSCPLPDYHCSTLNLARGVEHLRLFNVRDFIVRSDAVKQAIRQSPDFTQTDVSSFPPYELWQVKNNENRYVIPLRVKPAILSGEDWKTDFYNWFKRPGTSQSHLVHLFPWNSADPSRFGQPFTSLPADIPQLALDTAGIEVTEKILPQEIRIHTNKIGHPLLVKISYHQRWRVEGADQIYLASPSFMLLFPTKNDIRLTFGPTPVVYFGYLLTLIGWGILGVALPPLRRRLTVLSAPLATRVSWSPLGRVERTFDRATAWMDQKRPWLAPLSLAAATLGILLFARTLQQTDASVLYNQGLDLFTQQQYYRAAGLFARAMQANPNSPSAINAHYYHAICAFKQTEWQKAMDSFRQLVKTYPDSVYVPEALYHVGLCLDSMGRRPEAEAQFREVIRLHPQSPWAGHSQNRLTPAVVPASSNPAANPAGPAIPAASGPQAEFQAAILLYNQNRYAEADEAFKSFAGKYPHDGEADDAFMHHCFTLFRRQLWSEALTEFRAMISRYPASGWIQEAHYHLGLCHLNLGKVQEGRTELEELIRQAPDSRWAAHARVRLQEIKK